MKQGRWIAAIAAMVIMIGAWGQILRSQQSLIIRPITQSGVPMFFMAPASAKETPVPGVLVTHGYSGSKQLMLGYGHALAHGGYGVLLWDSPGHGSSAEGAGSFAESFDETDPDEGELSAGEVEREEQSLEKQSLEDLPLIEPSTQFEVALAALKAQPEVDGDRLALLGHSLGGSTSLQAGIQKSDEISATVAISSVPAPVTYSRPRNLQLQIGAWEFAPLKEGVQKLFEAAGGDNPQLQSGKGRSKIEVPQVEHTTILFSDRSHQAALDWFDRTFFPERIGASMPEDLQGDYRDRRIAAYLIHLLAGLGFLGAIAPKLPVFPVTFKRPKSTWLGLAMAPIVAGAVLAEGSKIVDVATLGGIQMGGGVAVWLLMGGLVWLGFSGRFPRPSLQNIGIGLLLFAGLWFAFGAMAHVVWLPWLLIPARLKLWPLLALAVFPWMLAAGNVQKDASKRRRLGIWLAQSLALILGLGLTIVLVPSLFFVALLLPFFPLILGMLAWIGAFYDDPWSYGVGGALFFGWLLAAVFPLV